MAVDPNLFAAKYLRPSAPRKRRPRGIVERADAEIPIKEVLEGLHVYVPNGIVGSWKIRCPFGAEHKDGGIDPNCRVYPSNALFCFALSQHGSMRPSDIFAKQMHVTRKRAAYLLLESRGLLKPMTYQELWAAGTERRKSATGHLGAAQGMVAALQKALERDEAYQAHELDDPIQEQWIVILQALDRIMADPASTADMLRAWLRASAASLHATAEQA